MRLNRIVRSVQIQKKLSVQQPFRNMEVASNIPPLKKFEPPMPGTDACKAAKQGDLDSLRTCGNLDAPDEVSSKYLLPFSWKSKFKFKKNYFHKENRETLLNDQ